MYGRRKSSDSDSIVRSCRLYYFIARNVGWKCSPLLTSMHGMGAVEDATLLISRALGWPKSECPDARRIEDRTARHLDTKLSWVVRNIFECSGG
jgi:hypothetical protein